MYIGLLSHRSKNFTKVGSDEIHLIKYSSIQAFKYRVYKLVTRTHTHSIIRYHFWWMNTCPFSSTKSLCLWQWCQQQDLYILPQSEVWHHLCRAGCSHFHTPAQSSGSPWSWCWTSRSPRPSPPWPPPPCRPRWKWGRCWCTGCTRPWWSRSRRGTDWTRAVTKHSQSCTVPKEGP